MAGPYGDSEHIRQLLGLVDDSTASTAGRLDALNVAVSLYADHELGRTFGETMADQTVLFWATDSDVLILPRPIRTITSLTVAGTVTGGTMTGGYVYDDTMYTHDIVDQDGLIYALRFLSIGLTGENMPVQIVGQWAAVDSDAEPPEDFVYAIDYLVAEMFKIEQASPAGFIGPDGSTVPIRNPWKSDVWLKVKAAYEISSRELVL